MFQCSGDAKLVLLFCLEGCEEVMLWRCLKIHEDPPYFTPKFHEKGQGIIKLHDKVQTVKKHLQINKPGVGG